MDGLAAIQFPHPWELRFDQLRLEPNRLKIQGHGLPNIDDLGEAWQRVEIEGELKALGIPRLGQERLGLGLVVPMSTFEALVPPPCGPVC